MFVYGHYKDRTFLVSANAASWDILYVLKNMFTIHESQLKIFPTEFPFARNKVEKKDISRENLLSMMAGGEELDKLEVELKEMNRISS